MDDYQVLDVVGEGTYGVVKKALHRKTGLLVAIKQFKESDDNDQVRRTALREIRLLRQLQHDNVVSLFDVFREKGRLYLVFEYIERTLLNDLEKCPNGLEKSFIRPLLYQLLQALSFVHGQHVIHRDVKPENILLSSQGIVKLCDFGFARNLSTRPDAKYTDYVATRWYRAPELLVGQSDYGSPVDVWALGCLVAELLTGQPLFPGESDVDQLHHIIRCLGPLPPPMAEAFRANPMFLGAQLPSGRDAATASSASNPDSLVSRLGGYGSRALSFVERCLQYMPADRPTCAELMEHSFFPPAFVEAFHRDFQIAAKEEREFKFKHLEKLGIRTNPIQTPTLGPVVPNTTANSVLTASTTTQMSSVSAASLGSSTSSESKMVQSTKVNPSQDLDIPPTIKLETTPSTTSREGDDSPNLVPSLSTPTASSAVKVPTLSLPTTAVTSPSMTSTPTAVTTSGQNHAITNVSPTTFSPTTGVSAKSTSVGSQTISQSSVTTVKTTKFPPSQYLSKTLPRHGNPMEVQISGNSMVSPPATGALLEPVINASVSKRQHNPAQLTPSNSIAANPPGFPNRRRVSVTQTQPMQPTQPQPLYNAFQTQALVHGGGPTATPSLTMTGISLNSHISHQNQAASQQQSLPQHVSQQHQQHLERVETMRAKRQRAGQVYKETMFSHLPAQSTGHRLSFTLQPVSYSSRNTVSNSSQQHSQASSFSTPPLTASNSSMDSASTLSKDLSAFSLGSGHQLPHSHASQEHTPETNSVTVTRQALAAAAEAAARAAQDLLRLEANARDDKDALSRQTSISTNQHSTESLVIPNLNLHSYDTNTASAQTASKVAVGLQHSVSTIATSAAKVQRSATTRESPVYNSSLARSSVRTESQQGDFPQHNQLLATNLMSTGEIAEELEQPRDQTERTLSSRVIPGRDTLPHWVEVEEEPNLTQVGTRVGLSNSPPSQPRPESAIEGRAYSPISSGRGSGSVPVTGGPTPSLFGYGIEHAPAASLSGESQDTAALGSRESDYAAGLVSLTSLSSLRPVTGAAFEIDPTEVTERLPNIDGSDQSGVKRDVGVASGRKQNVQEGLNGHVKPYGHQRSGSTQDHNIVTWSDYKHDNDLFDDEFYEDESREVGGTGAGGGGGDGDGEDYASALYAAPQTQPRFVQATNTSGANSNSIYHPNQPLTHSRISDTSIAPTSSTPMYSLYAQVPSSTLVPSYRHSVGPR